MGDLAAPRPRVARRGASQRRSGAAGRAAAPSLGDVLISAWRQIFEEGRAEVSIGRRRFEVGYTKAKHLRTVEIAYRRHRLFGIEQNPKTSSRWATMARRGSRIMQFSAGGRYVANVCDGVLWRYPAWRAARLPE
jgi:hypothetical protein